MKINVHLTGRLDGLFLDIDPANASSDRLMQPAGFAKLASKKKALKSKWKSSVNEVV